MDVFQTANTAINQESVLIDQIEKFPHLWDKKHKLFKDSIATQNSWETTATIVEMDIQECQRTWEYLRSKYVQERKLIKNIPSGSGSTPSSWIWFDRLGFLDRTIQTRRPKGNIPKRGSGSSTPTSRWEAMNIDNEGFLSPMSKLSTDLEEMQDSSSSTQDSLPGPLRQLEEEIILEPELSSSEKERSLESQAKKQKTDTQTPETLRRERNVQKETGRKKKKAEESLEVLVNTCTNVGVNLNTLLTKTSDGGTPDILKSMNEEDLHYALSLVKSLDKIKSSSKKLRLKASFLVQIADAIEEEGEN